MITLYPWIKQMIIKILLVILFFSHIKAVDAQSVKANFPVRTIVHKKNKEMGAYSAGLGATIDRTDGMHGITYKISFNESTIYPDSVKITASPAAASTPVATLLPVQTLQQTILTQET